MQALDVSNPYDKTGLGALSVKFKSPIVIDNETWPSVLNYVLAQALCSDTYKTILRNHRSGFPIFKAEQLSMPKKRKTSTLKEHRHTLNQQQKALDALIDEWREIKADGDDEDTLKKEHEISQFIDSLDSEIKTRFLSEILGPIKLQRDVFKKDIQEGKVVITLLSQWDARSGDLKNNLADFSKAVDFLPSRFNTVSAKDIWMPPGGEVVDLEKYRKSREAVKKEAQAQALSQVANQSNKVHQKVPVQIYRSVLEQILQDPSLLKQALKNQGVSDFTFPSLEDESTRETLIQNLNEIVAQIEDALTPLEEYIRLTMQLKHMTKQKIKPEELFEQWKSLSIEEKRGYFRPIMPVFQDLLFRCRLEYTNRFLNEVYEVVLNKPMYSDFLLSTAASVPRNLIYLDPFDQRSPLLGVGIINEHFIGSNNVGKVLEQHRGRLSVRKRDMLKEQVLLEKRRKQREFYIAYSQLRNLLRTRDIAEFVGKTVPEILKMLTSGVIISTAKRAYILYGIELPEEIGDEIPEELLVAVKKSGANIDLHHPDTTWEHSQNKKFPDYPQSLISYSFDQNRDFINDYFVYEQAQPGNLANFLRKQLIEDLYNRQVNLEKSAYLRGFLTYMLYADPQKRIEEDIIPTVVDHEMANMHSPLKIATEIDNIIQSEDPEEGFRELFAAAYPSLEVPLSITEDGNEIDIMTFLENFIEEQRSKGELAERVRTETKNKAKAWQKKTHLAKRQVVTRKSPQNTDVQELPLKDRLIAATLSVGNEADDQPYTPHMIEPVEDLVSVIVKEIPPVAGTGDIIFSSDSRQGGEQHFPLSPTENLFAPIIVDFFIFPSVLHAVCFLWLSKNGGLSADQAFLRLLKPEWVKLVNDMGLFPGDETKREMHPMVYFSEPLARFDHKLAEILTEIVQESLPGEDVSIPTVLHHLFYLKASAAFLPWYECWSVTMGELNQHLIRTMANALEKAHAVKFEDAKLAEVLLLTGESHLVNFDRRDNILGGQRKDGEIVGLNLVGENLMRLRQKLISETDIKPLLLSEDQTTSLAKILTLRMEAFKRLIEIIYKSLLIGGSEVETYVLTLKLARGIVSLYKINCGTGLQMPFDLSHLLQGIAKSFEKNIPKGASDLAHQTSDLVWSFAKVIFSCAYEGKNMDWEKREGMTEACRARAEKLIRVFMTCLVKRFGAQKYFSKVTDLTKAIISDITGRTAYFGSINFKTIQEHQLQDIIEGKLDYHDFQKVPPKPQVIDC